MMKNYLFLFLVLSVFNFGHAQLTEPNKIASNTIEGLHVFPNPVENGKIYISSKHNLIKTVEIYDVLGKRVITTSLQSKAVDISRLSPGIYILKIKEQEFTVTRKLVVR